MLWQWQRRVCRCHAGDYIRSEQRESLDDPAAADHDFAVVEDRGLAGSDGALRLVEGDEDFVVAGVVSIVAAAGSWRWRIFTVTRIGSLQVID